MSKKSMNVAVDSAELSQVLDTIETLETQIDENFDELYVPLVKKINMPKTVKTGVGAEACALILEGTLTTKEIVQVLLDRHPARKTTYACVAWYKNDMKKKGLIKG